MNTQLNCLVKSAGIIGQFGWLFAIFSASAASLDVAVTRPVAQGDFYAALHAESPLGWMSRPVALATSAEPLLQFTDLEPGRYALLLFRDANGNRKLDLSKRMIPREPVGVSNNPPLQRGRPAIEQCLFEITAGHNRIEVQLVPAPGKPVAIP